MARLITKYFDEGAKEFYSRGSFRIGTLSGYRKSENAIFRLTDTGEGTVVRPTSAHTFQNLDVFNTTIEVCSDGVQMRTSLNIPVFCASVGGFDARTAAFLKHGAGGYIGDATLKYYVEINFDKFLPALQSALAGTDLVETKIASGRVKYSDVGRLDYSFSQSPIINNLAIGLPSDDYRYAFSKPINFAGENEYRIVFIPRGAECARAAYDLVSTELRNSIVGEIQEIPRCDHISPQVISANTNGLAGLENALGTKLVVRSQQN